VPDTVSSALQARIAAPYPMNWDFVPSTPSDWRDMALRSAAEVSPHLPIIRERLDIAVEAAQIGGVNVFIITPADLPLPNRDRLLVHVHGGGYVLYPGEAGAGEAMLMAGYGGFKVVSVDYRMAPDFPFPAALDDAMAVWRALLAEHDPRKMAIFGSSAGGGLTLAMILKAKADGLPLPAALAPGTPWADLTGSGDSIMTNAFVDNALVSSTGWAGAAAILYAGGRDLRDPLLSPIYGDFSGFPPAILTSGTRDLFLSHTVRVHRKLRQAGNEAILQVFEGQSHAQFLDPFVPETEEAFGEIALFLGRHLAA
jgi:monoterpene epsilon-lactone hydrolase